MAARARPGSRGGRKPVNLGSGRGCGDGVAGDLQHRAGNVHRSDEEGRLAGQAEAQAVTILSATAEDHLGVRT